MTLQLTKPLLTVAALLIAGCTGFNEKFSNPADSNQADVRITPITVEMLNAMRRQRMKSESATPLPSFVDRDDYDYRIGARDVLSINVPSIASVESRGDGLGADSTQGYVVHSDGTIVLPYVGRLAVAGMTLSQAQQEITSTMGRFLTRPQFNVRVAEFRSQRALVVGQVLTSGYQPITEVPTNILDAITAAGGATDDADLSRIVLRRDGTQYQINLEAIFQTADWLQNVRVKDGDVVFVPKRSTGRIFVLGEVRKPEIQDIVLDQTSLADALGTAGWVEPENANTGRIYVIRGDIGRPEVFHLNAKKVDAILLADAFTLEPRDVVYVSTAGITRWNRFLRNLLPSIQQLLTGVLVSEQISDE